MKIEQILPLVHYNSCMQEPIFKHHDDTVSLLYLFNDTGDKFAEVLLNARGDIYTIICSSFTRDDNIEDFIFIEPTLIQETITLCENHDTLTLEQYLFSIFEHATVLDETQILEKIASLYVESFHTVEEEDLIKFSAYLEDSAFLELAKYAFNQNVTLQDAFEHVMIAGFKTLDISDNLESKN